jgi:hypothetical protein
MFHIFMTLTLMGLYYKTFNSSKLCCNVSVSHCQSFNVYEQGEQPNNRVTIFGKISPFGLLLRPSKCLGGNMVCCRYFKSLEGG